MTHPLAHRESGQSLVGTLIVGLFVLVPVFLLVPLLGKYIDLQSTALQAARNAAFERTIFSASGSRHQATVAQKSNSTLEDQTRYRFFSNLDQGIESSGYSTPSLWSGTAGNAFLPSYSDISVTYSSGSHTDVDSALHDILSLSDGITQGGPGTALAFPGLTIAHVQITPRAIGFPFLTANGGPLSLTFHARDALLTDGWDAPNSPYVQQQIKNILPYPLKALTEGMKAIRSIPLANVEDLDGLHLEKVLSNTPQEVPADHLQAYHP
jgi:hypothetical protein